MTPASTTDLYAPPPASTTAAPPLALDRSMASLGDDFVPRHVGPSDDDVAAMLELLGVKSLDELIDRTVPKAIRLAEPMELDAPLSEHDALAELRRIAGRNQVFRSYLGTGYTPCVTPPVIRRNVLENPGWYTQYTPYQAEIAQGRLEALLNFQTMVSDLTGLPLANASLLDEATAAAEAMAMCRGVAGGGSAADDRNTFFVSEDCHPQTIAVVQTRGRSMGIDVVVGNESDLPAHVADLKSLCGVLVQYPTTDGRLLDYADTIKAAHDAGALVVFAADILALVLVKSPGEWGADIAVGSTQRFGVPMGYGGPHAAYLATKPEYARKMPGRIVGVSKDAHGNPAYRLAIQTREQHIRREKATSNICTAQVLLAVMAGMYAVWHGPEGLIRIAKRVHGLTRALAMGLDRLGIFFGNDPYFDTLRVHTPTPKGTLRAARERRMNLRLFPDNTVGVTLDETTTPADVADLIACFNPAGADDDEGRFSLGNIAREHFASVPSPAGFARGTKFLQHPVFNRYHSETEMMRYIKRLESRDLSLTHSMIPLGSCTMKLNAAAEMLPVTWPAFGGLHPFAPADQALGYQQLFADLERWLSKITGFAATSLQPNAGSQGEYAGLLAIRGYHESRGEAERDVCLIPVSAHGTNPSSAVIAGMRVVVVACDADGNIDVADLTKKAEAHAKDLSALMITYPSTHGVFEENVREVCQIVHAHGGQVYMDGANMNAQVGLTSPGDIGADVCHLNLHKTFCIPPRRRRPGDGADLRGETPGTVPAGHGGNAECGMRNAESRRGRRLERVFRFCRFRIPHSDFSISPPSPHLRRPLRQPEHPGHPVDVHPHDGRRGADARDEGRDPERQLHRQAAGGALPDAVQGPGGVRRPRGRHGLPGLRGVGRRQGRGRRQAAHRLRLPRPDHELAGPRHPDDRADRERVQGRDRPLLLTPCSASATRSGRSRRAGPTGPTTRSSTPPTPPPP